MKRRIWKLLVFACLLSLLGCMSAYADNIFVGDSNGLLSLLDGSTLQTMATRSGFGDVSAMAVQSTGNVVVGTASGGMFVNNGSTLAQITSYGGNDLGRVNDLAVQADDKIISASSGYGGALIGWSGTGTSSWDEGVGGFGTANSVAVLANGDIAVADANRFYVRSPDAALHHRFATNDYAGNLLATIKQVKSAGSNGTWLASSAFDGSVMLIQPDYMWYLAWQGGMGNISGMAVRGDGDLVVGSDLYGGTAFLMRYNSDTHGLDTLGQANNLGSLSALAVESNGDIVYGTSTGDLGLLDGGTMQGKFGITTFGGPITALAVQAVPEPSALLAFGAGLIGLLGVRFSNRRRS